MSTQSEIAPISDIAPLIRLIRNVRVILDDDLARLYRIPTKHLNQQFRRNRSRFPEDFAFQLTTDEWEVLRSQSATSNRGANMRSQIATDSPGGDAQTLRSQIVTSKEGRGGRRYLPYAFTEHGALMVANILNSPRAVAMSVYVIRAFVKMREDLAANAAILKRLAEIDKNLLLHDTALRDIYHKLRPLLEPPPSPPKPEIGFHVKEDAVPYRVKRARSR